MAQAVAAAAAHSMPPFPLAAVPRVRPPPIPKGTPGPNTIPQPGKPPKPWLVWADGKWRQPKSRSALHRKEIVSRQLEKALRHEVHGMNIYAYRNIVTNQVVYSLTKHMNNTKMMKQMIFHGKKTVPAALRRDIWRPYFSVHFPKTPSGATKGLKVFQQLRELALKRQLSPPSELVHHKEEDVQRFINRLGDPLTLKQKTEKTTEDIGGKYHRLDMPVPGTRVPRFLLAKRLRHQKSTSVADIAAVLTKMLQPSFRDLRLGNQTAQTPRQAFTEEQKRRQEFEASMTDRAYARLNKIRKAEEQKQEQIEERKTKLDVRPGQNQIDRHVLDRLSTEYEGPVGYKALATSSAKLSMIQEKIRATQDERGAEQVLAALQESIKTLKEEKTREIEQSMSAEIESVLSQISESERDRIRQEVEAERADTTKDIEATVTEAREQLRKDRDELRARIAEEGKSPSLIRELRYLTRGRPKEILQMKIDLNNTLVKWVGPYSDIAPKVKDAMTAIDEEHEGALKQARADVEAEREQDSDVKNHEVDILWADPRDATYAESWPDFVYHGELLPKAVAHQNVTQIREHSHVDEDGHIIAEQSATKAVPRSNSVHVFGTTTTRPDPSALAYKSPTDVAATASQERALRIEQWAKESTALLRERLITLQQENIEREILFSQVPIKKEVTEPMSYWSAAKESLAAVEEDILTAGILRTEDSIRSAEGARTYAQECLTYVRENAGTTLGEFDELRLKWLETQMQIVDLGVQHAEAWVAASDRVAFVKMIADYEALDKKIQGHLFRKESPPQQDIRQQVKLDTAFPWIRETMKSRGLENNARDLHKLNAAIRKQTQDQTSTTTQTTTKTLASLTAQRDALNAAVAALKTDLRNNELLWKEFTRNHSSDYTPPSSNSAALSAPVSDRDAMKDGPADEEAEYVVATPRKSLLQRLRGIFGR